MSQKRFDLYVPISDDGKTTFAEVADILNHLATLYAWHPDVHGFLTVRANDARKIDQIYSEREENRALASQTQSEHRRDWPLGCGIPGCDVCRSNT